MDMISVKREANEQPRNILLKVAESCGHRFVRDEEAPRHLCCQVCGEVKNEADEAGGA